ncbi:hypothetical protein DICPUDRAFT_157354 [Dictyostelium purpureum]|uniref:Membrane insertase YidC/Oxa/ALB C-terminal domain-containing protein n=1 Tax=Dictyostelium purpureum TaxID=5786 RepID=F0ZYX3_DICPU|nr:uncharacterized protein DICPUDRAFT_157354 [Dictyostelium purpureum]EGC30849.1 hypothetical protein DICPUDRAFT_157354 [Dictyostelium purpureum]|eukprot:XP_003292615.1 hypothetical protein DICPUDRAFT_157354 [Dictyostelium purpureum]
MIRGIKFLNTKSGVITSMNRFQSRSFINSTIKSTSFLNNTNNKITYKRSYSTDPNNNSSNITDLSSTTSNITDLSTNATNIVNGIKYADYVKTETISPDESLISAFFSKINFDNIEVLNGLHENYGLSWVAIIAGMALALRVTTFPVTLRTQRISAKMRMVRLETEKHGYLNDGTTEGRLKLMQLQQQIMKKYNVSPLSAIGPNLVLLPLLIYPFLIIRQISDHTTLLDNTSFLWADSLSAVDPYYLLPILSSAFQLLSTRFTLTADTHPLMKGFMYSISVLPLLFTIHFSAGLNVYWCTNSILFSLTNLFFKSKFGANLFGLPYDDPKSLKNEKIVIAPDQFTPVKTIEEIKDFEDIGKKEKLQEQIRAKNELIEKRKEELKAFRRKKN